VLLYNDLSLILISQLVYIMSVLVTAIIFTIVGTYVNLRNTAIFLRRLSVSVVDKNASQGYVLQKKTVLL
jgi:hypothetical protein